MLCPGYKGVLYLVSTPIGNLEDVTLRALRVLKEVDYIACEDTRITLRLLQRYQIKKPLISYFEHNKTRRTELLIKQLKAGKKIALVSNAGTPLISDPGYELVRKCIEQDIKIIPIPGATALATALSISGCPSDRFIFEGFLPRKPGKRKKRLEGFKDESRTIIIYESPHRLLKTLEALMDCLGDRTITLTKELTKFYERAQRGKLSTLIKELENSQIKGEFTLVIEGGPKRRQ
ncbi:16S rRNA (cytidine(1402)-2'-O)-methyltransferase [Planctomycetota bacterium]